MSNFDLNNSLFSVFEKRFDPLLVKKNSKIQITQILISCDRSNQIKIDSDQHKQGYKIKKKRHEVTFKKTKFCIYY